MIGRKEEISVLEECLNSERPEFLVVYGRRRVGKTFLIKEFFKDEFAFYATGVNNLTTRKQLKIFNEALKKYGCDEKTIPKDWFEAFARLEKLLKRDSVVKDYKTGKKVVFLDELPWMDTARSDFKSALDYFWNSWASSQKDILFIVCGSATSWILNNIVRDTGGFYNRITRQIHLMPFSLNECELMLESNGVTMTRMQIINCYMILGGIPYYLNYLKPQLSLTQNIDALFFQKNAPLRFEFSHLFASLFKKSDNYIAIVRALFKHKTGMLRKELLDNNIISDGKTLTKCLCELEQCGFIRKYNNYRTSKSEFLYQLIDPLTLFYLAFLETGKIDSWIEFVGSPAYNAWVGLAFERVCLLHTSQIKKALGITGVSSHEYSWKSKASKPGAQIDLLIDRKDDVINICEIKYSSEEYAINAQYEKNLIYKTEAFRKETNNKKALFLTMITTSGIAQGKHKNIVVNEVTGDDLFSE